MKPAALLHGKQAFLLPRPTWRSSVNRRACALAKVSKAEAKVAATVTKRAEASITVPAPRAAESNILEGDAVIEKELAENGAHPPLRDADERHHAYCTLLPYTTMHAAGHKIHSCIRLLATMDTCLAVVSAVR